MKIKRLYIGDMGIYRNALMENISPKIVVIGGLNRSGKTTFLDILRNMPFGFPKNLRPSSVEYLLECDLENENKEKLSLRLNGLKEPQISYEDINKNITDKVYGDIDKYTYSQLFTITLDELKKLNNKGEEEKLQAVLLGAGINDIVHIPKLIENIRKDKEKIGGKNGSPNIKLFKPYYEKILSGVNNRDEALKQVEIFASKEEEVAKLNQNILNKEIEIDNIKDETLVLEILENLYDDYNASNKFKGDIEILNKQNLSFNFSNLPSVEKVEALYEEYSEVYNSNIDAVNNFDDIIKDEDDSIELVKYEDKIKYCTKNISGLKQRYIEINALKADLGLIKESLRKKMTNINNNFSKDYKEILDIQCDLISEDKLTKLSEDMKYLKEQKIQCNEEIEAENLQIQALEKELKSLKKNEIDDSLKKYLITSLGILCVSIFMLFLSKVIATGLFITGITSAALYYFIRQGNLNQINNNIMNLKLQLKTTENKQAIYIEKLENINAKEFDFNVQYNIYKEKLMIKEDISPQGLLQYFKVINEIKHNIINLNNLSEKIEINKDKLNYDLKDMYFLTHKFMNTSDVREENILAHSEEVFHAVEILNKELEKAKLQTDTKDKLLNSKVKLLEKLNLGKYNMPLDNLLPELINQYKVFNKVKELQVKIQTIEKNIIKNISSERVGKAFKATGRKYGIDKAETIDYLNNMFNFYPVKIEIHKDIEALENKLKEVSLDLDGLKEKLQVIKVELNNLSTSDKLLEAQRLIDEGRLNLKPLAVKFSVLSAAEYILETVQRDFLDDAKQNILNGAGEIFSKITSEEYKAVLPGDNLLQTDYKTIDKSGNIEESTSMLSRGTTEQLYLAVRLNRIKSIKQKLPIVFDDPFVNFDDIHVKNTLSLITDLAEENQIFILTCHKEVIKHIDNIRKDVQYWKLNRGKFEISNNEELIKHLTNK